MWWLLVLALQGVCGQDQGTSTPSASTDRAYLFDFFTCPECKDLNITAAMRCYDHEDPSEFCVQIRQACLTKCHEKEREYEDAILQYSQSISFVEKVRIAHKSALDFLPDEQHPRGGKVIRNCVTEKKVSAAWSVFKENKAFLSNKTYFEHCAERLTSPEPEATQLLVERIGECPLQWISPMHRASFYHTCLNRSNINTFRRRAISAVHGLQKIAFAQKAETEMKGSITVAGGSAQIVGGVLAGIGIILAPVTAGASLTLKIVGSGIALVGSLATLLSPNIIRDHESELEKLTADAEELSTLLLFYTQSSTDLYNFDQDETVKRIADQMEEEIKRSHLQGASASVVNALGFADFAWKAGSARMIAYVNEIQNKNALMDFISSSGDQIGSRLEKIKVLTGTLASKHQSAWELIKNEPLKVQIKHFKWKGTPLGLKAKIFVNAAARGVGVAVSFLTMSAMNIGLGIYQVLQGMKQMEVGFHYNIISAARGVLHESDMIVDAYKDLIGTDAEENFDVPQELYSVDIFVADGNWDLFSGGYLIFSNGQDPECTTPSMSFYYGWTKLSQNSELGGCQFYKIYGGNLSVALKSSSPNVLTDKINISTVQVATDGNHLPSLELFNDLVACGNQKSAYFKLEKIRSLKQIKIHTSTFHTDSWSYGSLKVRLEWKDSNGDDQRTSDTFYLGDYEDRDELGETRVYKGEEIASIRPGRVQDLLDYYPTDKAGLNISLKMEHYDGWRTESFEMARDRWHTDLLKLYFVGEQGRDIILTCVAGGEWINTKNSWQTFLCKIYRPDHPAKSLEMIKAHTCDILYSSTGSNTLQFKICKNRESFKNFQRAKEEGECCETNAFAGKTGNIEGIVRNRWATIDTIEHDGGEALGNCEGFELTGKAAYIAIKNQGTDEGCFDELKFYGAPGTNGSHIPMPFVTCDFEPVEFESHLTRRYFGDYNTNGWRDETDDRSAIYCAGDIDQLASISIGVCDRASAGSVDKFSATICDKDSAEETYSGCCTTGEIGNIQRNRSRTFTEKKMGSCRGKKLKRFLKVKFSHPDSDGMCIDYIKFNNNPICETCLWTDTGEATNCISDWKTPTSRPLQCDIGEGKTIKKLWVKVCDNEKGGTSDKIIVHMENDSGDKCQTLGLEGPQRNHVKEYSPRLLGPTCSKLQVTETTRIWLYTEPGLDDLCLTDLYLEVSSGQTGSTRSVRCRFDPNKNFEVITQGGSHSTRKAIPLKCT